MARLIGADTSTRATGVAIAETGKPLRTTVVEQDRLRAEELLSVMDALCRESGLQAADADAFVVGIGPGSFTGLRIGVTMMKTMAQFTNRPILGVSTLQALAHAAHVQHHAHLFVPVIDARANRLFASVYRTEPDGSLQSILPEDLYTEEQLQNFLHREQELFEKGQEEIPFICWAGAGIARHSALSDAFSSQKCVVLSDPAASSPIAAMMDIAAARFARGESDDVLRLVPNYQRKSQAELDRERHEDPERKKARCNEQTLRLRCMTEEDLPMIHQLEREAFQKAWSAKQLKDELTHPCNTALVAETDRGILGYSFSSDIAGEASLNRIAVAKEYRQCGIAKRLMERFLADIQQEGAEEAFLEVNERNAAAKALYQSFGFVVVGKRHQYYAEEMADALIMRCVLPKKKEGGEECHADFSH